MAEFQGYLLKIEGVELPNKYIVDYMATPNQIQDKDSYQDVDGKLHREILPHTRSKIEFQTPIMSLNEKIEFQNCFPNRKSNPKISVEYWNDEDNAYVTGEFYVPDIQFKPFAIIGNTMMYKPFRVALIEY